MALLNYLRILRLLARKAGYYVFFSILNRAVPFLLLPILTKYLSPADYGMVSLFSILTMALMPIIGLNSNTILLQRYFKSTTYERQQLISSSYAVMIVAVVVLMLLVFLTTNFLTSWLKLSRFWLLLSVLASFMGMVFTMLLTLLQIRQEVGRFGLTQLFQTAVNAGLSVLLVVGLGYGWQGRLSGIMIASALMLFYSIYLNLKRKDFVVEMLLKPDKFTHILKNGLLLLPASFAGAAMMMSDRFLLAPMVSLKELGIYSAAIMICQVLDVLYNAIGMAYAPIFFEKYHAECREERRKAILTSYGIVVLYFGLALLFVLISQYVVKYMLNERYHSAYIYIDWLAFGYAMMASGFLFSNHIVATERNKVVMLSSFLMLTVAVLTNYLFINLNGSIGAAQAMLLSGTFFFLLNITFSIKYNESAMRVRIA